MDNILKQFSPSKPTNVYSYGTIISSRSDGIVGIRTTSGLVLSIRDTKQTYTVGDQVVLGSRDGNTSGIFIIRKIDRICKASDNYVISIGQG